MPGQLPDYQHILEGDPRPLLLLDGALRVVSASEGYLRATGLMPGDVQGRTLFHLPPYHASPALVSRLQDVVARALLSETELPLSLEDPAGCSDTPTRWAFGHVRRVSPRDADVAFFLHVFENIELIDRRVQETQKLESLGVLAGGIAHDFNNLLMVIIGNTNLLRRVTPANITTTGYLDEVEDASRRAAELCQQLLAYAGKGRLVLEALGLNRLIEETAQLLRALISKRAELRFVLAPELPRVVADATQLRQVLMNLVINASEAIGPLGGTITVRTGLCEVDPQRMPAQDTLIGAELKPGRCVFVQVDDTGPGIAPECRRRIFEPFFTTKFTGRGLGLATVLGVARGHGGALVLRSQAGQGASFRVLLPLPAAERASVVGERVT
jgi:signal transduction histidine kinase